MNLIRDLYARFRVLIHEVAKFGVVGALAFVVTIALINALHPGPNEGLGPVTATTIANVVATLFAFLGNKLWAFRHRRGNRLYRETILFFVFNGVGLLMTDAVVAFVQYGLGLKDTLAYNVANVLGIGIATLFRLYTYRRWVFTWATAEPPASEQLEPETSGT